MCLLIFAAAALQKHVFIGQRSQAGFRLSMSFNCACKYFSSCANYTFVVAGDVFFIFDGLCRTRCVQEAQVKEKFLAYWREKEIYLG